MTKKDIFRTVAEELGLPQREARELVQKTLDTLVETLVREGRIELRNFGVFQIRQREKRIGRNPRTGERIVVPARREVVFKAGKKLDYLIQVPATSSSSPHANCAFEDEDFSIYEVMDDVGAGDECDGD